MVSADQPGQSVARDQTGVGLIVRPGDIVEVLYDGTYLPTVLGPTRPDGYRPGQYLCLNCGHDPYDPSCRCRCMTHWPWPGKETAQHG